MYQIINDTSARHIPSGTTFQLPPVESFGHDYQRWLLAGNTPEPAESLAPEQIIAQKIAEGDAKVAERLDAQARALGFDNITTAVVNASLPVGEYKQAEGMSLLIWRARTWQKAEEIRDAFFAGERPEPTWEEVESELPTYPITE